MADRPITIAGAGLSGLSAAITLAQNERQVTVYEKGDHCGSRREGDIEGLETWIFDDDPIDYMQANDLPIDFPHQAENSFKFIDGKNEIKETQDSRPYFYLVRRGADDDCIDSAFYRRAVELGVTFEFGATKLPTEVDIYGGGPQKAVAFVHGVTFESTAPAGVYLLLGEETAPSGYAYAILWNGRGTIASAFKPPIDQPQQLLEIMAEQFNSATDGKMENIVPFAGYGQYAPRPNFYDGHTLLIGEAAGWQDALFGFGMNFALRSGVLAAQSLIEKSGNYSGLCNVQLTGRLAASWVNRRVYERLSDRAMASLANRLIGRNSVWKTLHAAAQPSFLKRLAARWAA